MDLTPTSESLSSERPWSSAASPLNWNHISGLETFHRFLADPCSTDIRPTFPSGLHCSFYDNPLESDDEDEDQDAQYISIPFSSPFYHPLPKSHPLACDLSDFPFSSVSCDALSDEESFPMRGATLFHEALFPDPSGLFAIDTECLRGTEKNLTLRPMDFLEQNDLMSSNLHGANMDPLKSFPDVPEEVEIEFNYDCESLEFGSEEVEEITLSFSREM